VHASFASPRSIGSDTGRASSLWRPPRRGGLASIAYSIGWMSESTQERSKYGWVGP
jgi:hypothetical protein